MWILIPILSIFADVDLKNAASFLQLSSSDVEWNQTVQVIPVSQHHLNIKSPNECGGGKLQKLNEQVFECLMTRTGQKQLQVFVCDNQNTFCRREILDVRVRYPSTFMGWWGYVSSIF